MLSKERERLLGHLFLYGKTLFTFNQIGAMVRHHKPVFVTNQQLLRLSSFHVRDILYAKFLWTFPTQAPP